VRAPRWLVAASAGVVLVACSSTPDTEGDTAPAPSAATDTATPSAPSSDGPDEAAAPAPNELLAFSGRQLDGGTFDGGAVTGDVVVWFWTPW
jgi:hypothetical protein